MPRKPETIICPVCGDRVAKADVDKHLIGGHFLATLKWTTELQREGK